MYHRIDYLDRWRQDESGWRKLTLRRLYVLLRHLPPDSATGTAARGGEAHWSIEAHLIDDLRVAMTGSKEKPSKRHPARPRPDRRVKQTPERMRKIAAAKRRARERRRLIEAGEIT